MPISETNKAIADIFNKIADILEMQGVDWKPRAYRNAARSLLEASDVKETYKKGGVDALEDIPGIGEGIGKKIIQFIEKGSIDEYEKLKKSIPSGLNALMSVPGMGPKKAHALYEALDIQSIDDLKKAIAQNKIAKLKGFGERSEAKISESIGMQRSHKNRFQREKVIVIANKIVSELKKLKEVERIEVVGSIRRKEETIGDIDILVISKKPKTVMDAFTDLPFIKSILAKGEKKSAIVLNNGMQADLRVFEKKSFGAAMQYFTGNKQHNIELRKVAIKKGLKLNEYGLFDRNNKMVAGKDEEGIYKALGLKYIPPEKRKNQGELETYSR